MFDPCFFSFVAVPCMSVASACVSPLPIHLFFLNDVQDEGSPVNLTMGEVEPFNPRKAISNLVEYQVRKKYILPTHGF